MWARERNGTITAGSHPQYRFRTSTTTASGLSRAASQARGGSSAPAVERSRAASSSGDKPSATSRSLTRTWRVLNGGGAVGRIVGVPVVISRARAASIAAVMRVTTGAGRSGAVMSGIESHAETGIDIWGVERGWSERFSYSLACPVVRSCRTIHGRSLSQQGLPER